MLASSFGSLVHHRTGARRTARERLVVTIYRALALAIRCGRRGCDPCAGPRPALLNHLEVEAELVSLSAAAIHHYADERVCDRGAGEAPTAATDITPEEIMLCAMADRREREAAEELNGWPSQRP